MCVTLMLLQPPCNFFLRDFRACLLVFAPIEVYQQCPQVMLGDKTWLPSLFTSIFKVVDGIEVLIPPSTQKKTMFSWTWFCTQSSLGSNKAANTILLTISLCCNNEISLCWKKRGLKYEKQPPECKHTKVQCINTYLWAYGVFACFGTTACSWPCGVNGGLCRNNTQLSMIHTVVCISGVYSHHTTQHSPSPSTLCPPPHLLWTYWYLNLLFPALSPGLYERQPLLMIEEKKT